MSSVVSVESDRWRIECAFEPIPGAFSSLAKSYESGVCPRAPNRMRRPRVVTRMRWIQGRATLTYLYGMSRSSDAIDAHSRHNPQGRASFAASRHCSGSTGRGAPSSPSRLGLRQNTLRRGASHSVRGSKGALARETGLDRQLEGNLGVARYGASEVSR